VLSASVRCGPTGAVSARSRVGVLLIITVGIAGAIAVALMPGRSSEPTYQGKRLSTWIDDFFDTLPQTNQATVAAVQAIGTNAVPCLLDWLTNRPNALILRLNRMANILVVERLHWRKKYFGMPVLGRGYAVQGFRWLGHSGSNAIPTLLTQLPDVDIGESAAASLSYIGRPAVPVVIEVLTNGTPLARLNVAGHVSLMGSDALPVVPVLLLLMKDTNADLRCEATARLALLHLEPSLIMPALTNALNDPDYRIRIWALRGLVNFGPLAGNSFPLVINLLRDPNVLVRTEATNCFQDIERSNAVSR
jgi:hypothetical protein